MTSFLGENQDLLRNSIAQIAPLINQNVNTYQRFNSLLLHILFTENHVLRISASHFSKRTNTYFGLQK